MADRLGDYMQHPWYAVENDVIGGWCVNLTASPPSHGGAEIADFISKEAAEHIAELHNAWLYRQRVMSPVGIGEGHARLLLEAGWTGRPYAGALPPAGWLRRALWGSAWLAAREQAREAEDADRRAWIDGIRRRLQLVTAEDGSPAPAADEPPWPALARGAKVRLVSEQRIDWLDARYVGRIGQETMDNLAGDIAQALRVDERVTESLQFACRNPDWTPDFTGCGGPAAEMFWQRFDVSRANREIEFKRALLAEHTGTHRCDHGDLFMPGIGDPCSTLQRLAAAVGVGLDA